MSAQQGLLAGWWPEQRTKFEFNGINYMAKDRFDIQEKTTMNLLTETMVIVDKETGVNYLYVGRGYGGGLTPLIDADGKPIVTKDGYKK